MLSLRFRRWHRPFSLTRTTAEVRPGSNIRVRVRGTAASSVPCLWRPLSDGRCGQMVFGNGQSVEVTHPLMLNRARWRRTYEIDVSTGRILPRTRNKHAGRPCVLPIDPGTLDTHRPD